jgi:hypothetical protein
MWSDQMNNLLMTSAAVLAFLCASALTAPAYAQDEEPGTEVIDPMPDEGSGDGGEAVDGEEVVYDDGEPGVPYGPEDCIDCNAVPTMVDVGGRPEGENFRGDLPAVEAFSRSEGGSDDSDAICDHTKMGNAAKVCP